jgi:hypothetical protein
MDESLILLDIPVGHRRPGKFFGSLAARIRQYGAFH